MKEKKRFVILVTVFVLVSLVLNYLSVSNIFHSLNLRIGIGFYILLFFLSFSYPLTIILERYRPMSLTKAFYRIASIWIGIAFFSIVIFLIYGLISVLFTFNGQIGSGVVLSFIMIMSFIALLNGRKLKINLMDIEIKGLKKELKIVHLSDLHIGAIHQKKYLERVVKETNSLNPDIVIITGDLVDGSSIISSKILSPINKIKSPVYFVIGNHEIYEGLDRVMPVLRKTKMKILRNEKTKFHNIYLIGIDYSESRRKVIEKLNKIKIDKDKTNILLYHAPTFKLNSLEKRGISLHLAGHTHDGQIFPLNLLIRVLYPYVRGLHKSEDSNVFVSMGTGTWGPPMRLGSSNEITLINLKKNKTNKTDKINPME
ncbi:MAG: metallophosphoesterase [Candidatus Pacearchaeota archaeon]|nr:metallophosphoesterase [Candidatus Pacearchaeota archaeon]